jgi:hypothetical protein
LKIERGIAHVFFRDCEDQKAKKYLASENLLFLATSQKDERLEEVFQAARKKNRPSARRPRRLNFNQALEIFKARYPQTFFDYLYKSGSGKGGHSQAEGLSRQYHAAFGNGLLRRWVETRSVQVLVERSLSILKNQDLLYGKAFEGFKALLKDEAATLAYFQALVEILETGNPNEAAMKAYFTAVKAIPVPGFAKWPNITLFPFLARPERHMLLKPLMARAYAVRLGHPFEFEHELNLWTYSDLLEMARSTLSLLKPMGARDYLDVFAFMTVVLEGVDQKTAV